MRPMASVRPVATMAAVRAMRAVRGMRHVLCQQHLFAVGLSAQGLRRFRRIEGRDGLDRLASFVTAEKIQRRLPQRGKPVFLLAHCLSFTVAPSPIRRPLQYPDRLSRCCTYVCVLNAVNSADRLTAPAPDWPTATGTGRSATFRGP